MLVFFSDQYISAVVWQEKARENMFLLCSRPLQIATAEDYLGAQTEDCSEQQLLWCSKQYLQSHAPPLNRKADCTQRTCIMA